MSSMQDLITVLTGPVQDVEDALFTLLVQRTVDNATGKTLTLIGKIVGQARNGITDDDIFRRYVRARIRANRSSGTVDDILETLRLVLGADAVTLSYSPDFPAGFTIEAYGDAVSAEVAAVLEDMLVQAAGVSFQFQYGLSPEAELFQYNSGPGYNNGKYAAQFSG